jgi:hypothetical protein
MPKPDTTPLRVNGVIVVDAVQKRLDTARAQHRKLYNQGYSLSERGEYDRAQRLLEMANTALLNAERMYAAQRGH